MHKVKLTNLGDRIRDVVDCLASIANVTEDDAFEIVGDLPTFVYVGDEEVEAMKISDGLIKAGATVEIDGKIEEVTVKPKGRSKGGLNQEFYGNISWGTPVEQPKTAECPKAFSAAKELYSDDPEKNFDKVVSLIGPFFHAMYLCEEVDGFEDLFFGDELEIEASSFKIVGMDFTSSHPIPSIRAEAHFTICVADRSTVEDVDASDLLRGLAFSWVIDGVDDKYDLGLYEHLGSEFGFAK
jgi:hypothetical protein